MRPSVTVGSPARWDRQPGESEAAYRAFCAFRDMGADRSVLEAFRQSEGKVGAKQATGRWNKWVKDHRWYERVRDYENHPRAIERTAVDRVTDETAERWARRLTAQADADFAFSQRFAGEIARRLNSPLLAEMPVKDLKACMDVTVAASGLARAAIAAALPDLYADLDPHTASTEELTAAIERLDRILGAATSRSVPRIAR
jgi:hypothetical protein